MNDCEKWLLEFLRIHGLTRCNVVRGEAIKQGFSQKDLKSARKALGVKCWNDFAVNGETLNWFWYLPDDMKG